MQLVIADTGPVNYLILIGHVDVLPALFEKVILPAVVRDELKHRKAPPAVTRAPSAYSPWRQSVAWLISPRPSNVSSGPVFTTGRKPWISYLPMLHGHSSGFNTRAFAICRNVGNQE